MDSVVQLINEVGFPIAAAIGLGLFIWKLINRFLEIYFGERIFGLVWKDVLGNDIDEKTMF